jgi:hypothetical protein
VEKTRGKKSCATVPLRSNLCYSIIETFAEHFRSKNELFSILIIIKNYNQAPCFVLMLKFFPKNEMVLFISKFVNRNFLISFVLDTFFYQTLTLFLFPLANQSCCL